MTRDYKRKHKPNQTWRDGLSLFGWGMLTGVFISGVSYWLVSSEVISLATIQPAKDAEVAPVVEVPESASMPKPTFEFYDILPAMEVDVSDASVARDRAHETRAMAKKETKNLYHLQVGSFRRDADADRLKAELTLQGFNVVVESRQVTPDRAWYRVKVGPFSSLRDLDREERKLHELGLDTLRVKQTSGP